MIILRLNTTPLDLEPGEALQLTVANPLLDQDGAEALFSFPFKLPATARNLTALAHANRLDNADNTTTQLCLDFTTERTRCGAANPTNATKPV